VIPSIKSIKAEGQTFLSGGIEKALQVLTQHQRAGYLQRMFLFSDGLVNKGIKSKVINTIVVVMHTHQMSL